MTLNKKNPTIKSAARLHGNELNSSIKYDRIDVAAAQRRLPLSAATEQRQLTQKSGGTGCLCSAAGDGSCACYRLQLAM
jgi:hypothetical protein